LQFAQFAASGSRIVTTADDGSVRLWDTVTQKPVGKTMWHSGSVNSAVFSPKGERILTTSHDKTARLWNGVTGEPNGEAMRHEDAVVSAVFSPDGTRVVTASRDKTVRLWNAATGVPAGEVLPIPPTDRALPRARIQACCFGTLPLDGKSKKYRSRGSVQSLAFSPSGPRIIATDSEGWITLTDAVKSSLEKRIQHRRLTKARISPDGKAIASSSADGTVILTYS
jgi:WD40 repeat protein